MDANQKKKIYQFVTEAADQVGDLARWIHNPQRRFHRHEFFGLNLAELVLADGQKFRLRDLGYGGCGVLGAEKWAKSLNTKDSEFEAVLQFLDRKHTFKFAVRHIQKLNVGCEFQNPDAEAMQFLRNFIQYMDASLHIWQATPDTVFEDFRGKGWLNLAAHREAIRFNIRQNPDHHAIEANLMYVFGGKHIYCSWVDGKADFGVLNENELSKDDRNHIIRQIVCIMIGLRQSASLPNFGPVIEAIAANLS